MSSRDRLSTRGTTRRPEDVKGMYSPFPHAVQDSVAYQGASIPAKALLPELIRQTNGANNGRLHLAMSWLSRRGWKSCDVVQRAKAELIERCLIVETRKGGLNLGPSWFALTWLPITNYVGLHIQEGEYRRGAYALMNPMPKIKDSGPPHGIDTTGPRNSAAPHYGTVASFPAPPHGTKATHLTPPTAPPHGSNSIPIAIPQRAAGERVK